MTKTVVGSFESYNEAQAVLNELVNRGFDRDDISLVAKQTEGDVGGQSRTDMGETGSGALKGAAAGGALGGAAGLAIGIVGNIAAPGIGAIVAAGPVAAMLTGASVGAVAGGLVGALSNIGVNEDDASYYAESVRRGGALIIVKTNEMRAREAAEIMENHGALDIDKRAHHWRSKGWTGFNAQMPPHTPTRQPTHPHPNQQDVNARTGMREQVVPVIEEELKIGKREIQRGGARVYTQVVEQPVNQQVRLREEHVTVQERPANRPATEADLQQATRNQNINVTERAEEAVVKKEARVVGEVVINKEVTERTEVIKDKVRKTEVKVEESEHR